MRIPLGALWLTVLSVLACGGPSAALPSHRGKGGSAGSTTAGSGAPSTNVESGGTTAAGTAATGGTTSTYVEPTCPIVPTAQFEQQCDVLDQATCPAGEGCYPTITYPTAPCEPEIYSTFCLAAGLGQQWADCYSLMDCAAGFICVVGGIGTQCQRSCDSSNPTSCPKGLFCDAIDLPGIGTCY
jgi:hypothetical protein